MTLKLKKAIAFESMIAGIRKAMKVLTNEKKLKKCYREIDKICNEFKQLELTEKELKEFNKLTEKDLYPHLIRNWYIEFSK